MTSRRRQKSNRAEPRAALPSSCGEACGGGVRARVRARVVAGAQAWPLHVLHMVHLLQCYPCCTCCPCCTCYPCCTCCTCGGMRRRLRGGLLEELRPHGGDGEGDALGRVLGETEKGLEVSGEGGGLGRSG